RARSLWIRARSRLGDPRESRCRRSPGSRAKILDHHVRPILAKFAQMLARISARAYGGPTFGGRRIGSSPSPRERKYEMSARHYRTVVALALAATAGFGLAGCSSGTKTGNANSSGNV